MRVDVGFAAGAGVRASAGAGAEVGDGEAVRETREGPRPVVSITAAAIARMANTMVTIGQSVLLLMLGKLPGPLSISR
jgi:hypothetical protein